MVDQAALLAFVRSVAFETCPSGEPGDADRQLAILRDRALALVAEPRLCRACQMPGGSAGAPTAFFPFCSVACAQADADLRADDPGVWHVSPRAEGW